MVIQVLLTGLMTLRQSTNSIIGLGAFTKLSCLAVSTRLENKLVSQSTITNVEGKQNRFRPPTSDGNCHHSSYKEKEHQRISTQPQLFWCRFNQLVVPLTGGLNPPWNTACQGFSASTLAACLSWSAWVIHLDLNPYSECIILILSNSHGHAKKCYISRG